MLSRLAYQFTTGAAGELASDGLVEERMGKLSAWAGNQPDRKKAIWLTDMAKKDFESLSSNGQNHIREILSKIVEGTIAAETGLPVNGLGCVLLRVNEWRLVGKSEADKLIVYAVGHWSISPCTKVWRYLDQSKAEDFLRMGTLYFRRLDLLEDEFEGVPPVREAFAHWQGYKKVFAGTNFERSLQIFDHARRSEYTCCWRLDNHESWLFWKQYCPSGGGIAIQTTYRKLRHLHISFIGKHSDRFPCAGIRFERVKYIDHQTDESPSPGFPSHHSAKRLVFANESEIRLLLSRFACLPSDVREVESQLALFLDGEKLKIEGQDLLDTIVVNPFAKQQQRSDLMSVLRDHRPTLASKLRPSEVSSPPITSLYSKPKR